MSRRTPSRLSLPVLLPGPEREISGPGQRILLRATFPSVRKPCQKGRFKVPPARKNGSFPFCGSLGEPKTPPPRRNPAALFRSPPGLSLFARSHPPRLFPFFPHHPKTKNTRCKKPSSVFLLYRFCRTIGFLFRKTLSRERSLRFFCRSASAGTLPEKNRFRSGETGQYPYR